VRLIIGLGNPGLRYKFTRHNMGFLVIDEFSKRNSLRIKKREYSSLLGRGKIRDQEVILMKPLTYMNLSGSPIKEMLAKEGLSLERMMVICDDTALELGTIRIRVKGSSGGHRGLESIICKLENDEFPRMRIGIGRKDRHDLADYVLSGFRKADLKLVNDIVDRSADALDCWISEGIQEAMNRFNS